MEIGDPVRARLENLLERQRASFLRRAPGRRERDAALATLLAALREHEADLVEAVDGDFGGRAHEETRLLELFPIYQSIRHARRHLRRWMRPRRVPPTWFLLPGRARVEYQPLGVVGVIGTWNYPLLLSLSPVVGAIAAGNRVLVKPSETAPRTAETIAGILAARFPPEVLAAVTGGPDVAAAFAALPFDHLLFTGSTRVGRLVMRAASEHLTPLTLELGGKSPCIVHRDHPVGQAASRIATGKLHNAGQTCVAPDYAIVHPDRLEAFRDGFAAAARRLYPTLVDNRDYTRIVTAERWWRLRDLVEDARERGAGVVEVAPPGERFTSENRVFPPTLVIRPPEEAAVLREEIFGPILPLVPAASVDEAIAYVNARPRPLALYYFDRDRRRAREVLARTISGGAAVNEVVFHLAQESLPFGGVGESGMGHYHGFDGFATFSKKKGVFLQSRLSPMALLAPPYGPRKKALISWLLRR